MSVPQSVKRDLTPFDILQLPLIYPFLRAQQVGVSQQAGVLAPHTASVFTQAPGTFTPLFNQPTPAIQGQIINFSGDTILIASNSSGTGKFVLPPTGVNIYPSFNFGPIDLSQLYVAGQNLTGDEIHIYWEA
jgi:hypothetical protein